MFSLCLSLHRVIDKRTVSINFFFFLKSFLRIHEAKNLVSNNKTIRVRSFSRLLMSRHTLIRLNLFIANTLSVGIYITIIQIGFFFFFCVQTRNKNIILTSSLQYFYIISSFGLSGCTRRYTIRLLTFDSAVMVNVIFSIRPNPCDAPYKNTCCRRRGPRVLNELHPVRIKKTTYEHV